MATDWLMAAFAGYWAVSLIGTGVERGGDGVPTLVWGFTFVATALAALLGGVVHGFASRMGPAPTAQLWRATLYLVALGNAGMLGAVLLVFPATPLRAIGLGLVVVKLVAASVLLARAPVFRTALADHAAALAAVLVLQGVLWVTSPAPSAPWIVGGVAVSAVAGGIQAAGIAPHPRFNHNDLYHLVQIGALWLLYRGGLLLAVA